VIDLVDGRMQHSSSGMAPPGTTAGVAKVGIPAAHFNVAPAPGP
jgi:hypothetical protein